MPCSVIVNTCLGFVLEKYYKGNLSTKIFLVPFTEDERAYGYVRLVVGDELSKRVKFALITWIGPSVSPMKKAAVSTDKGTIKSVFQVRTKPNARQIKLRYRVCFL